MNGNGTLVGGIEYLEPAGRAAARFTNVFLGGLGQEVSGRDRRRSQETMRAGIVGFVTRRFKERESERGKNSICQLSRTDARN